MTKDGKFNWALFFDDVHILSVNSAKQEVRLFENGGAGPGRLVVQSDQAASFASTANAMDLFSLALKYAVKYELIIQCASEEAKAALEKLGAKDFLDRIVSMTNDTERRMRFQGFDFSFAGSHADSTNGNGANGSKPAAPATTQKRDYRSTSRASKQTQPEA